MLTNTPPKYKKRNRGKPNRTPPRPPPLEMINAAYDYDQMQIQLEFDRAVNASGFDPTQIRVDDGVFLHARLIADDWTQTGPTMLLINLITAGLCETGEIFLNATPNSGLRADDDGGTWPGVSDYPV